MNKQNFDRLVSAIRDEKVDDTLVAQSGERVFKSLAGNPAVADLGAHTLRSCEDFQAMIPAYIEGKLVPARKMLMEDHVHGCVACRHALENARAGETQMTFRVERKPRRSRGWNWAFAGMAAGAMALVAFAFANGYLPGQHTVRGEVESVSGGLYMVSGEQVRVIPAGYSFTNADEIRTAKGSTAVLRLVDGSRVEMGERANVAVSNAWKGTTIHLDGGQVIVQAAKQHHGHLFVATNDCLVSVKGTIFSVNHGVKGSRVAVIEGVVNVNYGDHSSDLHPGDEATSSPAVSKVPIQNEIAWSKDSAKYLALLGDFAILQKQFAAIPGPGLRYTSDLLPYVPEDTVFYAAIPNLSNTLGEASRLFEDRLKQSPALRDWWKQQEKQQGKGPKLEEVFNQIKTFSGFLGDEIVIADGKTGPKYSAPVILARVRQSGLEDFLRKENGRLSQNGSALQIFHNSSEIKSGPGDPLLVYLEGDLLIASPEAAGLQATVTRLKQGNPSKFADSPFYEQIAHAYQQGAEWLFCADMEQIVVNNVHSQGKESELPPGMSDVRYLTMEHREVGGKPESEAALSFASQRQGVASWLGAPASMGSLDFVSPDASMATSVVIKNPRSILEELFQAIGGGDAKFAQHLSEFESKTGVRVLDDIAAPLGGEVTLAFDGPVLPTPRWKMIFEVYDPATLQSTIEKLVESFNREAASQGHSLQLTQKQVGSQMFYVIASNEQPAAEIYYSFVDSYLIAAPDAATISRAMQIRKAGFTLPHSATFQALVPNDGYTNFSAIFYHNIGPVVGPIAQKLKSSGALTAQQRQSIDALTANSAPGMIYAYGEPDRIVVASHTGFMGFDLGTLLTMGHNGPFLPQMLLGGAVGQTNQTQ